MIRELLCKKCKIKVGEEITVRTNQSKLVKLCEECKKDSIEVLSEKIKERNQNLEFRKNNSYRMKNNNPMFKSDVTQKVSSTLKKKYESGELKSPFQDKEKLKKIKEKWKITDKGRQKLSERMKIDNPMYYQDTKKRMMKSFKEKIKSGEISYKYGIEHHLFKGNRGFCDTLRVQLFPKWTKKCLERDNFTCIKCKIKRKLTVHHVKPLREFIKEIMEKYDIKTFNDIPQNEWQKYFDEIISNHKLEDGITLCKVCHSLEDKFYNFKEKG